MSERKASTNGDQLVHELPSYIPNDPNSPNYALLDVIGHAIDELDEDVQTVSDAIRVRDARTIDQLFELAKMVGLPPHTDEPVERYRARVFARFALMSGEGTVGDLLYALARILDVDVERIGYREMVDNPGTVLVFAPGSEIEKLGLSASELAQIVNENVAAGYQTETSIQGTFTYRTPQDYDLGENNPEFGYGGLDENGEPTGDGGTYAGYLE
ncbi:hypothetical protein [Natronorubrum sulfidifaciens]|uniref:Uncharacterized protein n=1 Tax=Natronorubrum sulfidifaciens JCM 14089 TaxID=1230460 RepID=L9WCU9_9EURY|nr:hypothetical protein [Natronorubrum sulfidifaciens]ELY47294.1 hypothetical protein C495_03512 [Natronorubrum sulfidifaciens JCM 14089]